MAYNTQAVKRDSQNVPVPQVYNSNSDAYEVLQGANGAMRIMLYDANGNPLLTAANPGVADVTDRAARLLGKITADDSALTQIGALAAVAVTDPTASGSVIALLKGLLKQVQGSGSGRQPVLAQNSTGAELFTTSNPAQISLAKTFKLAWNTPVYFIADNASFVFHVVEMSATTYKTGQKTVGTTGIELFGGTSRLANRYKMIVMASIKNTGTGYMIENGGTTASGFGILPGDILEIEFTPA